MSIAQIFISDDPGAEPRPGELHVWFGPTAPPRGRAVRRARTLNEAARLVASRPARIRVALADPLPLLTAVAASAQGVRWAA